MALSHEDRMIKIERIEPNPMRDLDIYPITADKTQKLAKSYAEGDFGTIIPVRPHPTKHGYYQQACGHHRIRAMQLDGRPLEILCRIADRSDDEMMRIMVRENMNNYGNNPEAVADSVASMCKVLIYQLYLAESYEHFSTIVEKAGRNPIESADGFGKVKGRLVQNGTVGSPVLLAQFGPNQDDWPLTRKQVEGALASLSATGKMEEVNEQARIKAEREMAATKREEIERAEIAERKAKEAADARAKWEAAEAERKERRKAELAAAKAMKDEMERKTAEARLAKEKAEADRERRRMKAIAEEQARLEKEAKEKRDRQARIEAAQEKNAKAKENAEKSHQEPWIHTKAFGMFENQGQFDVFRTMLLNPEMRRLFPVDQQVEIIAAMLEALRLTDNMTGRGIKQWMTEQDAKFKAEIDAKAKAREALKRKMEEEASLSKRVDRTMEDFQANLARLSRSYAEVHELMQDADASALVLEHPYAETLRYSLESQYKQLPEIEKLFRISARRVQDADRINPEEKVIN